VVSTAKSEIFKLIRAEPLPVKTEFREVKPPVLKKKSTVRLWHMKERSAMQC